MTNIEYILRYLDGVRIDPVSKEICIGAPRWALDILEHRDQSERYLWLMEQNQDDGCNYNQNEYDKFKELMEKATNRQIPLNVILAEDNDVYCPRCGNIIDEDTYPSYCSECGQHLEWRNQNEK